MNSKKHREIVRSKKELGYYWAENPVRQLSISPAIMKRLAVRVVRKGIHESRKIHHIAKFIDTVKPIVRKQKSIIPKKTKFATHKKYTVSIVIPVFNKKSFTLACLNSLVNYIPEEIAYEVIVIDNNSTDGTGDALKKIPGLTYHHNDDNKGFVDACNQGASMSKADYLVFLNNDTRIEIGWLEALLETIKRDGVGLVGSKLLYPNTNKLQEAGGIIFNNATGHNYGKNCDPLDYKYNYVREVDYCSGASIIIERKLFNKLGMFDRLYAPAYYEDTDLSFKVRKAGYKVLYQPASTLYHVEGATAGTSTSSGFKKYQDINKIKFDKKWASELKKQQPPGEVYLGRDRSADKLVLIVDENLPRTDEDSGSVRMFRIMESFIKLGYKVTFFPYNTGQDDKYAFPLQQLGVEVVYGNEKVNEFMREYGHYYDVVVLSRPRIASYFLDFCRVYCKNAKIIYDTVDLHYLRSLRQAKYDDNPDKLLNQSKHLETVEKHLMEEADVTIVVSDIEQKILKKDGIKTQILSNIHEIDEASYKSGFSDRKDLLFVGGYGHPPNVDAVKWFVDDIFPLIHKKIPGIMLHVVGSNMPASLHTQLESKPGVVVEGFVSDSQLRALLQKTKVFVAPLRYGAGVKGKIGQAIEFGLPVVSTSIGAEGMRLVDGKSCMVADSEKGFAKAVVELYNDKNAWDTVQHNARKTLTVNFSPEKTVEDLSKILR